MFMTMEEYFAQFWCKEDNSKKTPDEIAAEKKAVLKVKKKFDDNNSISHRSLIKYLAEVMPQPIPLPKFAPRPTRIRNATKMLNSLRSRAEIHDLEVMYIMQVMVGAMKRSQGLSQLHYGPLMPSSCKGIPLPTAEILKVDEDLNGTTGQVIYTFDHFELLIFNTELLENPQTRDTEEGQLLARVIHVDSLDYQLSEPCVQPVSSVHSDMGNDIIRATGNAVYAIPGVLQPRGSRVCGVCACVNQLLLVGCNLQELLSPNCIDVVLEKFNLPARMSWTKENWIRAGLVLVRGQEIIHQKQLIQSSTKFQQESEQTSF
jgi:hypothetical protein